jgi:D-alanine-D-alanine ligase
MTTFISPDNRVAVQETVAQLHAWRRGLRQEFGVALVYGPVSAEDQFYFSKCPVEQMSITALAGALTEIGTRFQVLDPRDPAFISDLVGYDVALSNLHGPYGEDGRLQGLLDYLRKPYCGSGVLASAVAADKIACKRVMESLGVPTPQWQVWTGGPAEWDGQPVMVKPPTGGSSVGMSLVRDQAALLGALVDAAETDGAPVLMEEYIPGVPVTVGLLELPAGEVLVFPPLATKVHSAEYYDAETKLDADSQGTVTVVAADLSADLLAAVTGHAKTLWDGLGIRGSARVDFMVTDAGELYTLEVNTIPGMSKDSNFVTGADLCGLGYTDVVLAMLHEALVRPTHDVPLPTPLFAGVPAQRDPGA